MFFRILFSVLNVRKSSVNGPERDVYTGNSGAWQQSLRGAARSVMDNIEHPLLLSW